MIRRAVLALAISLLPSSAWAAARPDGKASPPTKDTKAAKPADKGKKVKKLSRYAPIELFQINTKESLLLRFYDERGKPVKGWKKRFDKFMRCHQTGTVFKMDNRLAQMLYQVGRHYEGRRIEVISGYRHPRVAKNPKSPHKQGLACDFRVPGVANTALRDYLRKTFAHAGVGYYPNSVFVHLDNRKQGPSAFWIDCAGPGQAAAYAENPREGLRDGQGENVCARSREAGGLEGADDMAQAGEAGRSPGSLVRAGNNPGVKPMEIKTAPDPFGD